MDFGYACNVSVKLADAQASHDEVLKKIGRNLLLFQQAELLIKRLVALDSLAIRGGGNKDDLEKQVSKCDAMTMGQVANLFLERLCQADPPAMETEAAANLPSIRVHIRLGGDPAERRKSFDELIRLRNGFVHQLLPKLDADSEESCAAIAAEMDELRRTILPEIQRLQQDLRNTRESVEAVLDFLETPAGMEELMLPEIRQSPLVRNLAEIAAAAEPHAWIPICEAVRRLEDFPQEAIRDHLQQLGKKSLTALLHASRLFDTVLEPSESGHKRALFRLKQPHPGFPLPWLH